MKLYNKVMTGVLGVALLATACGGEGGTSRGVSDESVKVGMVGPYSGPVAVVGLAAQDGAMAYIEEVNNNGGVHGRQIEVQAYDDGYTVGETVSNVRRLVEQDGVFALVSSPIGGPHTDAVSSYAAENELPIVGPFQGLPSLNATPMVFPTWATMQDQMYSVARELIESKGIEKLAVSYYDDSSGEATQQAVTAAVEEFGAELVADIPFEASATDMTSVVETARSSGAEGIIMMAGTAHVGGAMSAADDLGWEPQWGGHTTISDPGLVDLAGDAVEGAVGAAIFHVDPEASPEMEEFTRLMSQALPDSEPTNFHLSGYTAARLFVEALERVGEDLTVEAFVNELESGDAFNVGTLPKLVYQPADHIGNPAVRVIEVRDGELEALTDWVETGRDWLSNE